MPSHSLWVRTELIEGASKLVLNIIYITLYVHLMISLNILNIFLEISIMHFLLSNNITKTSLLITVFTILLITVCANAGNIVTLLYYRFCSTHIYVLNKSYIDCKWTKCICLLYLVYVLYYWFAVMGACVLSPRICDKVARAAPGVTSTQDHQDPGQYKKWW